MNLTPQQLRIVFPLCRDPNLWASILPTVADEFDINTKDRFAAWLAQIGYESSQFNALREDLSYSKMGLMKTWPKRFPTDASAIPYERKPDALANFVYANRLGNGDEKSGDGWKYRGGGLIETTGRANYRATGVGIGRPLEEQPNLITVPANSARAAGWFWKAHNCNHFSDERDMNAITLTINGPMKLGEQAREMNLAKLLTVLQ